MYSGFIDNFKILKFIGIYFWEKEILNSGGQNQKISKVWDNNFVERSILRFWTFSDVFYIKIYILDAFKHLPLFYPK